MVLSQLDTGVRITSFKEMMLVLQNEEDDCLEVELRKGEKTVHTSLSHIIKSLEDSKKAEDRIHYLISEIEGKVLQRAYELKLPQRDYLKVHIPRFLAGHITRIEQII